MIDDDLKNVTSIRTQKRTMDPEIILQIIENSMHVCFDLGLGVFCFNRNRNPRDYTPYDPIALCSNPMSCTVGLLGPARHRAYSDEFPGRSDWDYHMRTLLVDRMLYADRRFYFDHGRVFRGGNVGIVTSEMVERSTKLLNKRWGRYLDISKPTSSNPGVTINVRRRQR